MFLFSLPFSVFAMVSAAHALPSGSAVAPTSTSSSLSGTIEAPIPATTTVSIAGQASNAANKPDVSTWGEPIEGSSFFYIGRECFGNKSGLPKGSKFADRAAFYKQAYQDAGDIAASTYAWPQLDVDVSDMYFGKGTENPKYAKDISG